MQADRQPGRQTGTEIQSQVQVPGFRKQVQRLKNQRPWTETSRPDALAELLRSVARRLEVRKGGRELMIRLKVRAGCRTGGQ